MARTWRALRTTASAPVSVLGMLLLFFACTQQPSSAEPSPPAELPPAEPAVAEPIRTLPADGWHALEEGLDLGVFTSPVESIVGDSRIAVLRADPERYDLVLHMASAERAAGLAGRERTAQGWATAHGDVAAINAAMFRQDRLTSTHYMAGHLGPEAHVNNSDDSRDNMMLVFDPVGEGAPVAMIDRGCGESFDQAHQAWRGRVQSIRMVDCNRHNRWGQQPKMWSHAVVGLDGAGRVLFIHARSPWSTHDFVDTLLDLPIDLARLQYAEGGPEAQLWVGSGGCEIERVGSYETGFCESDANTDAWVVPNVLALRPR